MHFAYHVDIRTYSYARRKNTDAYGKFSYVRLYANRLITGEFAEQDSAGWLAAYVRT